MHAWWVRAAAAHCGKIVRLDSRTHALSGDYALLVIGTEQKGGKLFAAEPGPYTTGTQRLPDHCADLFQSVAAHQMPIGVVHFLEIIYVHHQDAERHCLGLSAGSFATQLGKKRFAGQQSGQLVMDQQAMDLLLKLAVNLVEHFEADQLIADLKLVTVLQQGLINRLPVEDG